MLDARLTELLSQGPYTRLREAVAIRQRQIVVAIGSGVSSPIAGWSALNSKLIEELEARACSSDTEFERLEPVLDQIQSSSDPWSKFESIKQAIPVEYRNIIRSELGKSQHASITPLHRAVWKLPLAGVVSLNIDTFARRAASEAYPGVELKIEVGKDAGRIQRIMHSQHRFIYELHGSLDDSNTWTFTSSELKRLYKAPGYVSFLNTLFTTYTVIFVGISADDIAIGSPLSDLSARGIEGPEHYWITDRLDEKATSWANSAYVELVRYPSGEHDLVPKILGDLANAVGSEPSVDPISSKFVGESSNIEPPAELMQFETAEIRRKLNQYANHLLRQDQREEFDRFVESYDELVDRAWYIPPNATGYELFDYRLLGNPTHGAFGSVYRVEDKDGNDLALKLLKREIRSNLPLLHSFRRGVEAMKIVEDRKLPGMVAHRDASEIPTFVTMEWIEGPNLRDAKEAHLLQSWSSILAIADQTTQIVMNAHGLPEKLLHRDLRPSNVMLRNGWTCEVEDDWDVVVLDFDLATYTGATTDSVLADGSALGYLAPEQLVTSTVRGRKTSSRNTLVDSFGIGMTLYFLVSGTDPDAYMHRDAKYLDKVVSACSTPSDVHFACIPARIARLIVNATRDQQVERWSVPLIARELQRLREANNGTVNHALDSDLIAEEIACRCPMMSGKYTWSEDDTASYTVSSGPSVTVHASASDLAVVATLNWLDDGTNKRKSIHKYLTASMKQAEARLGDGGWKVESSRTSDKTSSIRATYPVSVDSRPDIAGASLSQAIEALTVG